MCVCVCVCEREHVCVSSHEVSANQSAVTDPWTNKGSHSSVIAPSVNRWPFDLGLVHRNDRDHWTRDLDHNEANTLINYIDLLPRLIASISINKVTSYRIVYSKIGRSKFDDYYFIFIRTMAKQNNNLKSLFSERSPFW